MHPHRLPATTIEVTRPEAGQKLLQFLMRRLGPDIPRSAIMKWIRTGQVRVDGGRKKPFHRLEAGQSVRLPPRKENDPARAGNQTPHAPRPKPAGEAAASPAIAIIARHKDLLLCDKPAGLASHPGTGHADSLASRLKDMFPDASFAPTIAHRLDRDTTGLVLVAMSYRALREVQDALRAREIRKTYLAMVHGTLDKEVELELEDRLTKTGKEGGERMRRAVRDEGKLALARARAAENPPPRALAMLTRGRLLLEVELLTGRSHQIRVQLAARGLPIVGDRKYGKRDHAPGLMLHAWRLELPDGASFETPPPWRWAGNT